MLNQKHNVFFEIKEICKRDFKKKEWWPSYYERRYLEFLTFYDLLPKKKFSKVLELGCGMGYYSAFLSEISDEVIATDLESSDPQTHSLGLQTTRDFLSDLKIKNVQVIPASAEELPFEDNSFDMVFSSHVLEHVPDATKAIREINRVLKPGGINFCVVPTTTDRIYAFLPFHFYLLKRLFVKLFRAIVPKHKSEGSKKENKESSIKKSTGYYLKYFPFPPPHGVLKSYPSELRNWSLSKWRKLITKNGEIKLLHQYGLQSNPLLTFAGNIFPQAGVKIYSWSRRTENKLAKNPIVKRMAISTLLITEKTNLKD